MKNRFLCRSVCFQCAYKRDEAIKKILETIDSPENNFKLMKLSDKNIIFCANTGSFFVRNSFLPFVTINLKEYDEKTFVFMTFKIKKGTKIMIDIYNILLSLFEIFLIESWLTSRLNSAWFLFMPIGMILYSLIISVAGFRLSSKSVLKVFIKALNAKF